MTSNETAISHRYRCKTIRRKCASAKTRVALGKAATLWAIQKYRNIFAELAGQSPLPDFFCGHTSVFSSKSIQIKS